MEEDRGGKSVDTPESVPHEEAVGLTGSHERWRESRRLLPGSAICEVSDFCLSITLIRRSKVKNIDMLKFNRLNSAY